MMSIKGFEKVVGASMSDNEQSPLPGPGRELDALVHLKLGHSEWFTYESETWEENGEEHSEIFYVATSLTVPKYSTSIEAAWELVEKAGLSLLPTPDGKWFCGKFEEYFDEEMGVIDGTFCDGYVVADTAPLAIVLAFLALPNFEVQQ